jgi:hypothetical protein
MGLASRCCRAQVLTISLLFSFVPSGLFSQTCQTANDMDPAFKTGITVAAQRYFDFAVRGDTVSLRQSSIPSLASDFTGIDQTIKDHQQALAGAQPTMKGMFLLNADNATPNQRQEFYCGVFGKNGQTANSAAFYLESLPPGKYAVVLFDANSAHGRTMFSEILQQLGNDWKLGGLYLKSATIAGHDSDWFLTQARQYKAKGQVHDAWFYYLEARNLISPLSFMSTLATDKLYDESASLQPADLPGAGKSITLSAGTSTYKLTATFPEAVGNDLDLIVRYESANVGNTNLAYQENVNVMKALVEKIPEVREAFAAVVARAVDTSGHDYGTLLAMKDIK